MARFHSYELALKVQRMYRQYNVLWKHIDKLESAFLFYDKDPINFRLAGLPLKEASVTIDLDTLDQFGCGLMLHNHPNGDLRVSKNDWLFAQANLWRFPELEYGVIVPNFSIRLYKVSTIATFEKLLP